MGYVGVALCLGLVGCGRVGFDGLGAASDAAGDGSQTGDGPDAAVSNCGGSAHKIVDNFDDGVMNPAAYTQFCDPGMTIAETGDLKITLAPGVSGNHLCGYESVMTLDLRDSRMFVEVAEVPVPQAQATLLLIDAQNNGLEIIREGTVVAFKQYLSGVDTYHATLPYDAFLHRWWQLREKAGTTYWETSADGTTWTIRHSRATPFVPSNVKMNLYARTWQVEAAPGLARFASLNGGAGTVMCE